MSLLIGINMKFNNGVQMALVEANASQGKCVVIPKDGRFLVCRHVAMTQQTFDIVDDCRTEGFANARAAALNTGSVQDPTLPPRVIRMFDKEQRNEY